MYLLPSHIYKSPGINEQYTQLTHFHNKEETISFQNRAKNLNRWQFDYDDEKVVTKNYHYNRKLPEKGRKH